MLQARIEKLEAQDRGHPGDNRQGICLFDIIRMLSVDGPGIRGLVPGLVLVPGHLVEECSAGIDRLGVRIGCTMTLSAALPADRSSGIIRPL